MLVGGSFTGNCLSLSWGARLREIQHLDGIGDPFGLVVLVLAIQGVVSTAETRAYVLQAHPDFVS